MTREMLSVVISNGYDGVWTALHTPSGRRVQAASKNEVEDAMRKLLGIGDEGEFTEPPTSDLFSGVAKAIAQFLEGHVSESLSFHSGFARLDAFEAGTAHVRLGGGCQGCPSSQLTLINTVRSQLQSRFGDDVIVDVILSI